MEEKDHLVLVRTTIDHKDRIMEISSRIWEGQDYLPNVWDTWIEEDGFFTILYDDIIIGCLKATYHTYDQVTLEGLRLAEEYRGKGLSTIAVEMLQNSVESKIARERLNQENDSKGNVVLRFATGDVNEISRHLGETHGFTHIASFHHRFLAIENFVPENLISEESGTGISNQIAEEESVDFDLRHAVPGDIEDILEFIRDSDDWLPAKGLISYGWVFYGLTKDELEHVIGSGVSLVLRRKGAIQGVLLAGQSEQRPENLDISWISGPCEDIRRMVQELIRYVRNRYQSIYTKVPVQRVADCLIDIGFSRHPRVDCAKVFEKRI